jgi:hypothetical protein
MRRPAAPPAHTEVLAKAQRRKFSAEYKLAMVEEADRATDPGEIGSLLRRKGLYSSWSGGGSAPPARSALCLRSGPQADPPPLGRGEPEVEGASGPSGEETPTGRNHHRRSKNVSALLGITRPETDRDESNLREQLMTAAIELSPVPLKPDLY